MFSRRLVKLALVGLGAMLGACATAPVHKPGDEYLKTIQFEGNKKIGNGDLTTGLALHRTQLKGLPPDPYLVSLDADRVKGEYLRRGFLDVDVRTRTTRQGDATTVTYTVEEGVRATTRVVITGLPENEPALVTKVRAALPLADGAPFSYEAYDLAKPMLKGAVEDAGYAHVKLESSVIADRANHTAIVRLDYTPGAKCVFGPFEIHGAKGPMLDAVRDRLEFQPGQQYTTAAITASQRNLYGLGRFSTVRVQPDREGTGSTVAVKVDVAEGARRELKLGGGVGIDPTSYEVRGRVGYSIAGWPLPMQTASVDLRPAYAYLRDGSGYEPRIKALAKLEHQDILWTYSKGEVEGGYNYIAYEAYTSFGPRARLGFSTRLWTPKVLLNLGWGIESLAFRKISLLINDPLQMKIGIDGTERNGAYTQALVVDLRNNQLEPTRGAYGELKVAEGTAAAGGAYNYIEVVPDLRGYIPLFGGTVLAARVRTGAFFGDVPATQRFFGGGGSGQRGFSERKLSPFVQGDVMGTHRVVPYGGSAMVETGLEGRFPITTIKTMPLGGVVFLDGGDVTEKMSEISPVNLHWALGLGLRLKTIVGPVRADIGYRLNRKTETDPDPGSTYAFHFSLGEAF